MNAMRYKSIEEFSRVICFQHVKRNVDKYLAYNESKDDIKSDIHTLQECQSKELFDKATLLFLSKWKAEKVFLKYFEKTST